MTDSTWYVQIDADRSVLGDLELLAPDARFTEVDPSWIEVGGSPLSLTDESWDREPSSEAVLEGARSRVKGFNDVLEADSSLHAPILVTGVVWKREPNSPRGYARHIFVQVREAVLALATCSADVTVNGFTSAPYRTLGLRSKELVAKDQSFFKATTIFEAAGSDIRHLWVAFEYIKDAFEDPGLKKLAWVPQDKLASFCETANEREIRHKNKNKNLKHAAMTGSEARAFIKLLLNGWVDAKNRY